MKFRREHILGITAIIIGVFALIGCSEPREGDNWYQESVDEGVRRDAYIQDMERVGISSRDARKQYDLDQMIENTIHPPPAPGQPK